MNVLELYEIAAIEKLLADEEARRRERVYEYEPPSAFTVSQRVYCKHPEDYLAVAANSCLHIAGYEYTFKTVLQSSCAACNKQSACQRYSACTKIKTAYMKAIHHKQNIQLGDSVLCRFYQRECLIIKEGIYYRLLDKSTFVVYDKKYAKLSDILPDLQF